MTAVLCTCLTTFNHSVQELHFDLTVQHITSADDDMACINCHKFSVINTYTLFLILYVQKNVIT